MAVFPRFIFTQFIFKHLREVMANDSNQTTIETGRILIQSC